MSCIWRVDRSLLNDQFAGDVTALLSNDPDEWVIIQGFRTYQMQATLYEHYLQGGALAAPPGHSAHEKGLAVDVVLMRAGVEVWNYRDHAWRRLVYDIHMHPRLHSLDDIGDTDHIEAVNWRKIAAHA